MFKIFTYLLITILISNINSNEGPLQYPEPAKGWIEGDCQSTQIQSPINIPSELDSSLIIDDFSHAKINSLSYSVINSSSVKFDHGHKWTTTELFIGNLSITLNNTLYNYKLHSIHFHLYSEHRLQNKQYPMEMHMVHKNLNISDKENENLVIGVFFDYKHNIQNEFLNKMQLSTEKNIQNADIKQLIHEHEPYYYYKGSLTTVPCTENVNWIVYKDVKHMSFNQFNSFSKWIENSNPEFYGTGYGNARGVKNLNGRKVYLENFHGVVEKEVTEAGTGFMGKMLCVLPFVTFLLYPISIYLGVKGI